MEGRPAVRTVVSAPDIDECDLDPPPAASLCTDEFQRVPPFKRVDTWANPS